MFDRNNLEELAAYESTKPVVSLYLNLAPHLRSTPEAYRARLKSLLKEVRARLPMRILPRLRTISTSRLTGRDAAWPSSPTRRAGCGACRHSPCRCAARSTLAAGPSCSRLSG